MEEVVLWTDQEEVRDEGAGVVGSAKATSNPTRRGDRRGRRGSSSAQPMELGDERKDAVPEPVSEIRVCVIMSWRQLIAGVNTIPF